MTFLFDPPAVPTVAVHGSADLFPVRRIYCVGRNFAAHVREMGLDPDREPPFFFMKPADAIVASGSTVPYPPSTSDLHYEIELVVAIGKGGRDIAAAEALDHVYGYAVGVDLTRRDRQIEMRELGRPWEIGKAFDHAAPISAIQPAASTGHPQSGRIWLEVNGLLKQDGDLAQMVWNVPEVIASLSASWTLAPGDLIFTGTPAGVGATQVGDVITGGVDGIGEVEFVVGPPAT